MITSKLMAHFVCNIVDVERVANRRATSSDTTCLITIITNTLQVGYTSTTGRKYMTDVVVGRAYDIITGRLILTQHGSAIIIGIRVSCRIGIDNKIVISNNIHTNSHFSFIHPIDTIHRGYLSCLSTCNSTTVKGSVLTGSS